MNTADATLTTGPSGVAAPRRSLGTEMRRAFDVRENLRRVWARPAANEKPVDGLRAFAVLWVIGLHALWYLGFYVPREEFEAMFLDPANILLLLGNFGVDVFFVISGYLIGGILMAEHQERGRLRVKRFYIRRYMRLTPAYVAALLLYAAVFDVPILGRNMELAWTNLLYINNFFPIFEQCMTWGWSLAIEEQFYLVFPAFLLLVYRVKRFRFGVLLAVFALALVIRGWLVVRHDIRVPLEGHPALPYDSSWLDVIYTGLHVRYGGLLAGILVAYLLRYTRLREVLSKVPFLGALGVLSFLAGLAFYVLPPGMAPWEEWSFTANLIYVASYRYVFALGVAGLLLATLCAERSWAARFLSWRCWYPVAQLSYSAYLLHAIVITTVYRHIEPVAETGAVYRYFLLFTALTLLLSLVVYVFVERPFMSLRRWVS